MVINRKRFFSKLVVDFDRADARIGLEHLDQFKAQPSAVIPNLSRAVTTAPLFFHRTAKQLAVKDRRQWVALGHAGGGAILTVRSNRKIISAVQDGFEARQLVDTVIPVHLEIEVAVINSGIRVVAVQPDGEAVVPRSFDGWRWTVNGQLAFTGCQF